MDACFTQHVNVLDGCPWLFSHHVLFCIISTGIGTSWMVRIKRFAMRRWRPQDSLDEFLAKCWCLNNVAFAAL